MSIDLIDIRLPKTRHNPNGSVMYFLKIKKGDDEMSVSLTKDEITSLYNQIKNEVEE